jgi:predicted O-methyltransferase YrrM
MSQLNLVGGSRLKRMRSKEKSMLNTFVRKVARYSRNGLWNIYARRDSKHLLRLFPELGNFDTYIQSTSPGLRSAYDLYVSEVSTSGHAISWEVSVFLSVMTQIKKPIRILDTGSGFSSYTLRLYSLNTSLPTLVCSVDDSPVWLKKTETFLSSRGMATEHLFTWTDFCASGERNFDLIFHDLGRIETRAETLPFILTLLNPAGVVILDDMHKKLYRPVVGQEVHKAGLAMFSARQFTLDGFGRFAHIATFQSR